jgi:hypothetical protein
VVEEFAKDVAQSLRDSGIELRTFVRELQRTFAVPRKAVVRR